MDSPTPMHVLHAYSASDELSGNADEVDIAFYENEIPSLACLEMDRLYGHLYCSPRYFEAARAMAGASLYTAKAGDRYIAVLPYKLGTDEVTVASEYLTMDAKEIERFAEHMFQRYAFVKRVTFPKVRAQIGRFAYPAHAITCGEDMVVQLPRTVKDYEAALGKSTRRNIKRYTNALAHAFPSYRYELYLEGEISEQDLRDVVALSCLRLKSKNIVPRFDETEIRWIADFARSCGILGVARIEDKVCAGAIGFRLGNNYFMHVIAHHPKYNDYSLGILCYYHTICEGIARGARHFHLLQGRYGYKYRLLAERQDFIHLDIYRNRKSAWSCIGRILRKEAKGRVWLGKQWLLHDLERKEGKAYRFLSAALNILRRAKRSRGIAIGSS